MHCSCPHCSQIVVQKKNVEGPNFCPKCCKLFYVPPERELPPWILGVLVVLVGNWQLMCRLH